MIFLFILSFVSGAAFAEFKIPKSIETALYDFSPKFKMYPISFYPKDIVASYDFNKKQMMSAVLGDFNNDGKVDAMFHGSDELGEIAIRILSSKEGYRASHFNGRHHQAVERSKLYKIGASWQYGMRYFSFAPKVKATKKDKKPFCAYAEFMETVNADGTRHLKYCWIKKELVWDGMSGD